MHEESGVFDETVIRLVIAQHGVSFVIVLSLEMLRHTSSLVTKLS